MLPSFQSNPRPQKFFVSPRHLRQPPARLQATRWLPLFILIGLLSGVPGTILSIDDDWYESLTKPVWEPPGWLCGVLWPLAYILASVAAWLAWRAHTPMLPWALQWCFNVLSATVFYAGHSAGWAFFFIIAMVLCIYWAAWTVSERDMGAAIVLTPYLLWISVKSTLIYVIWALN